MGYNTSVIVLNDTIHDIAEDHDFGARLADAVLNKGSVSGRGKLVEAGHGCRVVGTHHADYSVLVAFGGNYATELGSVHASRHGDEEVQVMLLKMLADKLGYRVVKKKGDA